MIDHRWYWQSNNRRCFARLRFHYRNSLRWNVGEAWRWLWKIGRPYPDSKRGWRAWMGPSFRFFTRTADQHECYCPHGTTTYLELDGFGLSFGVEVSRSWVKSPCHCDKIIWLLFPDGHEDDIEDYGLAKLQAEYPGVGAA